jgi:hypothetical protein
MQVTKRLSAQASRQIDSRQELANAGSVLLIEATQALSLLTPRPGVQTVVITHRRMLSAEMLQTVRPDAIVAPLIAPRWDLVELASALAGLGYRGAIHALTRPLPHGELIVGELSALYPQLNFGLLEAA